METCSTCKKEIPAGEPVDVYRLPYGKEMATKCSTCQDAEIKRIKTAITAPTGNEPTRRSLFKDYRRKQIAELRPYVVGEVLDAKVSVSAADKEAGSPKDGDMIARNPKNHEDQWLVAAQYFADNFEPV